MKFWLPALNLGICRFWVQNVKLGQIRSRHFNGLKKTWLEPKFEISISKNKGFDQKCTYQKVWKILLWIEKKYWNLETCSKKLERYFFIFIFCETCQKLLVRPLLPDYLLAYSNCHCEEKETEWKLNGFIFDQKW